MEENKYICNDFQEIGGHFHLSPNELFLVNGQWCYWKDMTQTQKKSKKEAKLRIAESSHDTAMEEFWQHVAVE